eukprot:10081_1
MHGTMDYFDEPDDNDEQPSLVEDQYSTQSIGIDVAAGTPINTMSFFDEPDVDTHAVSHAVATPSPPPPTASLSQDIDHSKLVDVIPEDTEKDEYRDADDEEQGNPDEQEAADEQERLEQLEADLESIKTKLDHIKAKNEELSEQVETATQKSSLTAEYDKKIMQYDQEFHQQQKIIEEEERIIAELQKEFEDKLAQHNIDEATLKSNNASDMNGIIRNSGENENKHAQKSSIMLFDNSFAINHQLQLEIDKLEGQIEWLQTSKIELVINTAGEVDRLRDIIKQFGGQ